MLSTRASSARQIALPLSSAHIARKLIKPSLQGSLRYLSGGASQQSFRSAADKRAIAGLGSSQSVIGFHAQTELLCNSKCSVSQTHLIPGQKSSLSGRGSAAPSPAVLPEEHAGWADVLQPADHASDRWQFTESNGVSDEAAESDSRWQTPPQHWALDRQLLRG